MHYLVELAEVHKQQYIVEANSPEEAKDLAYQGELDGVTEEWGDPQYHRTMENSAIILDQNESSIRLKMAHSYEAGPTMDNKTNAKEDQ